MGGRRPGGKQQMYLGQFELDESAPYRQETAPDSEGRERQVLVFRLLSIGPVAAQSAETPAVAPTRPVTVEVVASEANSARAFVTPATPQTEGERREAVLMRELEHSLQNQGHTVGRLRITPPGESSSLYTDTYDSTADELFEIKPDASRQKIREAVSQLLDYRRHANARTYTVLVPAPPSADLQDLVRTSGLSLAVFASGRITRLHVATPTRGQHIGTSHAHGWAPPARTPSTTSAQPAVTPPSHRPETRRQGR